jgi:2-oxoisovalerate dehydrogenase E1 component alpha subunit
MVRSRLLEERMIKMSKSGEGYFWVGGPGEEAFNVPLGLQIKKGQGPAFDMLHLHYRNSGTLIAMGMSLADPLRQMMMTTTDPHSMGRNFPGHYAGRDWNIIPVSSVLSARHVVAPGTAMVQKRLGGDAITIVVSGDAGTQAGDFASCLVWSTRPGQELPILIIVMNNGWGISTSASSQHGEKNIIDRGLAFGIPGEVVDGNDPVASWHALRRAFDHCRHQRRPFLIEAKVSRLHGHSSASGALRVKGEPDCLQLFEERLIAAGLLDEVGVEQVRDAAATEIDTVVEQVSAEPRPTADDIEKHTYAASILDRVYPHDYEGLPA